MWKETSEERALRYQANKERIALHNKSLHLSITTRKAKYFEKNKQVILEQHKEYKSKNIDKQKKWSATRVAREIAAGGKPSKSIRLELLITQDYKCKYCSKDISNYNEIDHRLPLFLGGTSDKSNLQMLCKKCNKQKSLNHPDIFEKSIGIL
jgi:hypothetical protein